MPYDQTDAFFLTKQKGGGAVPALLTNSAGETAEIPVIYDRESTLLAVSGNQLQSAKPQCVIQSKYLPNAEQESEAKIIIDAIDYNVVRAIVDSEGTTTLILSRD